MKRTSFIRLALQIGGILLVQFLATILLTIEVAFLRYIFNTGTFLDNVKELSSMPFTFAALATVIGTLLILPLLSTYSGCRPGKVLCRISFSNKTWLITASFLLGFLFIPLNSELENLSSLIIPRLNNSVLMAFYNSRGFGELLISMIAMGIVPAVVEELYFRRYLQRMLILGYGTWPGILLASLLFAAMHLNLAGFLSVFSLSILMGIVYEITGDLLLSMIIHMTNNIICLFLGYAKVPIRGLTAFPDKPEHVPVIILVFCFAGIFYLLVNIRGKVKNKSKGLIGKNGA